MRHARFLHKLPKPCRLIVGLFVATAASACTMNESRDDWAQLIAHDSRFPMLYAQSIMIMSVDDKRFGPKYKTVWVKPGYHEARIAYIDCALPVLVVTCVSTAGEEIVPFEAEAGKRYYFRKADTIWVQEVSDDDERLN